MSNDRYALGRKLLENAYGAEATEQTIAYLNTISEDYSRYLVEAAFADVYGRPGLDQRQREVVNVIALTSLGGLDGQLERHIAAALDLGTPAETLVETIFHLTLIIGHPKANTAFALLRKVLDEREA